jgi:hypothetical protein
MDEIRFNELPLPEKAAFIQKQGSFIEAADYYSYKVFLYVMEEHHVEVVYDDEENLISVEYIENTNSITPQLESDLDENIAPD